MIPYDQILVQIVNGLVNGMILALVASGLTLIFGIMDIVNFAHGDLFMLGAYIGTTAFLTTGSFWADRKSTRLNSSHGYISYAVFCLKKKKEGDRGTEILAPRAGDRHASGLR